MSEHLRLAAVLFSVVLALTFSSPNIASGHGGGGGGGGHSGGFGGGGAVHSGGFGGFSSGFRSEGFSGYGGSSGHPLSGFSTPHSYSTFSVPHSFDGALRGANSWGGHPRTTQHFGNLGTLSPSAHDLDGTRTSTTRALAAGREPGEHGESGHHRFFDHDHFFFPFPYYGFLDLYPYDLGYYYPDYYDYYAYGAPYAAEPMSSDYGVSDSAAGPAETSAGASGTMGEQYYADAVAAFERGDYQTCARLAGHALIEMPREVKSHELMSLVMFARGDYRAAAMEAHAALILGPVIDWSTLYSYYNDLPTYTRQLEALAKYLEDNPSSMDARFLLAYHDLIMGHLPEAKSALSDVVAHVPQDKVAANLLKQLESGTAKPGPVAAEVPRPKS